MQSLKSSSLKDRLLATTRALSHDPNFFPSDNFLGDVDEIKDVEALKGIRGFLNDQAFCHRFHHLNAFQKLLQCYELSEGSVAFLKEIERFRYHSRGIYFYKGTKNTLSFFCSQNSFILDPFFKDLYAAIVSFFEEDNQGHFSSSQLLLLEQIKGVFEDQHLFLKYILEFLLQLKLPEIKLKKQERSFPETDSSQKVSAASDEIKKEHHHAQRREESKKETSEKSVSQVEESILERASGRSIAIKIPALLEGANEIETKNYVSYKVFTKKYDEVIEAMHLVSQEERKNLFQTLSSKSISLKEQIKPFAQKLYHFLKTQSLIQWEFDKEEGYLYGGRLAQKVINPAFQYVYKSFVYHDSLNTAVTLLVDNSGSMRGRPITLAALSAYFLAQTLEQCGVKLEILGFTTGSWKGGNSYQEWDRRGRPPFPGRLNDIRHIIYKSFDTPWRRARLSLGAMLKEGILKENIDGEALLWASKRLINRPEYRKILIVISDGASIDDMTLTYNSPGYLEDHLKSVIRALSQHPNLHLFAIGIGHNVERVYPKSITLKSAETLAQTLFEEVPQLFKRFQK